MIFTVFTPTYNRGRFLKDVYTSLVAQTFKEFEWIVIDDGSIDETELVINQLAVQAPFPIKYRRQQNRGKHVAINRGVKMAQGLLMVMLDSDDRLPPNSLAVIYNKYLQNNGKPNFGGIAGRKAYFNGEIVGSNTGLPEIYTNSIAYRFEHKIKGDVAEVFLTSVLREFSFPEIENEKFCPEALVWNRIAKKYNLQFIPESIYECEYLPDGLTATIVKIRMNSPQAAMIYYSELEFSEIPFLEKLKANINYWRFSFNSSLSIMAKLKLVNPIRTLIGFPIGLLMFLNDKRKI